MVEVWLGNRPDGDVFVGVRSLFGQIAVTAPLNPEADDDDSYKEFVDDDGIGFTRVGPFTPSNWNARQSFEVSESLYAWPRRLTKETAPVFNSRMFHLAGSP